MEVRNYTDFRSNMANVVDLISEQQKPLIVTRRDNKKPFVVLSLDSFNQLWETAHILSNRKDRNSIKRALKEFKKSDME